MKAEERKRLERNELAEKLTHAWEGVSAKSGSATKVWTVILAVLVAALLWVIYSRFTGARDAALWGQLDSAFDVNALKALVKESPNSVQGQLAQMQIARVQFQESVGQLAAPSPDERVKAADAIEEVRKSYGELARSNKLPPILIQEALAETARAEEILASVPKSDAPTTMRGSLDQAIKLYDELKSRFPESFRGQSAGVRADELRKKKVEVEKLYGELAKEQGKPQPSTATPAGVIPALPTVPPLPGLTESPKSAPK